MRTHREGSRKEGEEEGGLRSRVARAEKKEKDPRKGSVRIVVSWT